MELSLAAVARTYVLNRPSVFRSLVEPLGRVQRVLTTPAERSTFFGGQPGTMRTGRLWKGRERQSELQPGVLAVRLGAWWRRLTCMPRKLCGAALLPM